MSTTKQTHVKVGSQKRTMYLIAALLLSLGAMVGVFWYVGAEADFDKEYIGYTGEQQVLSQRIAKNALEASLGSEEAFAQLATYRDRFEETLENERNGNVVIGMLSSRDSVADELLAVEKNWEGFRKNVDHVLKG
ncbi:MAG: type IV pili methyl-accepting chemotaxis transducer N-terminal domain-containing protein, partial [Thiogranum sp.]